MKQYIYNESVYNDLNALYKENRKDNLVTFEQFRKNIIDSKMTIDEALIHRDLSKSEEKRNNLVNNRIEAVMFILFSTSTFIMTLYFAYNLNETPDFFSYLQLYALIMMWIVSFTYAPFAYKAIIECKLNKRKKIKELDIIIEQEHKDIEAKIDEQLKLI
jgi:hypothetical protein